MGCVMEGEPMSSLNSELSLTVGTAVKFLERASPNKTALLIFITYTPNIPSQTSSKKHRYTIFLELAHFLGVNTPKIAT